MKPSTRRPGCWSCRSLCVAFSAILPLMTVVNYSVQDIISPERRVFVGTEWFKAVMRDEDLQGALGRQIVFSSSVLLLQIPLGIALAWQCPPGLEGLGGAGAGGAPLLIPWNVVGTIWQILRPHRHRPDGPRSPRRASTTATPAARATPGSPCS